MFVYAYSIPQLNVPAQPILKIPHGECWEDREEALKHWPTDPGGAVAVALMEFDMTAEELTIPDDFFNLWWNGNSHLITGIFIGTVMEDRENDEEFKEVLHHAAITSFRELSKKDIDPLQGGFLEGFEQLIELFPHKEHLIRAEYDYAVSQVETARSMQLKRAAEMNQILNAPD